MPNRTCQSRAWVNSMCEEADENPQSSHALGSRNHWKSSDRGNEGSLVFSHASPGEDRPFGRIYEFSRVEVRDVFPSYLQCGWLYLVLDDAVLPESIGQATLIWAWNASRLPSACSCALYGWELSWQQRTPHYRARLGEPKVGTHRQY